MTLMIRHVDRVILHPLHLLIVQPTPFCNINCDYCYLPNRASKARMTLETVAHIADFVAGAESSSDELTVVWHAGEPLTMPIDFYKKAFEILKARCTKPRLRHNFQTNGMLIDQDWCELFKVSSATVSVSIDGPKDIHDAHRVDRAGRGTFDRAMQGVKLLKENGVSFSVLGVMSRVSLDKADVLWDLWTQMGVPYVGINIEELEGAHKHTTLDAERDFWATKLLFERLAKKQQHSKIPKIRELEDMRRHFTAPPNAQMHRAMVHAGSIISIDCDGNISTYSPELLGLKDQRLGEFCWGNVHHDTWQSFAENPELRKIDNEIQAGIRRCRESCGYFAICGGGNPSNKLAENGTFDCDETLYCRLHVKAVADVVMVGLERELKEKPGNDLITAGV
jgi:uncharacterized protein